MVSRQWKKVGMLAALLGGVAGAVASPAPQPVLVRFEKLYWVGAKSGLPRLLAGQVIASAEAACDVLGVSCVLNEKEARISNQTAGVPLTRMADGSVWLPFAALAKQAGFQVVWDASSKTATVSGGSGSKGWRYALDYVGQPQNIYPGPLQIRRAAPQYGKPKVAQTIFAAAPLQDLSYFSKSAGSLNIVGAQVPSSADVPNTFPGCGGKLSCTLPAPRDALWTLALVTTKP